MEGTDTIAAVATPPGEGGIGIIRISGPRALDVALGCFRPVKKEIRPGRLYFGRIFAGSDAFDEGFLVYMKGPASYTGEDVVELQLHGGVLIMKKALEAVVRAGARVAGPGEFTRRAFIKGKIDLLRAEAVIDLIKASTEAALGAARARLEGGLSKRINSVKETVSGALARLEATLDFPEYAGEGDREALQRAIEEAKRAIKKLLATYGEGRAMREGIRVLILGRPNVGKSSLLNLLLREERAIVTHEPGTTRDVIEETLSVRGLAVKLMDTAGLRETADFVESLGVKKARQKVEAAGLILFVVDSSAEDFSEDLSVLKGLGDKKVIIVANKTDLLSGPDEFEKIRKAFIGRRLVFISALTGEAAPALEEAVFEEATGRPSTGEAAPGAVITSARHFEALRGALEALERADMAAAEGLSPEFVAADLREALTRLGELTGEVTTEEILDRIFSEFCIGK